jgi:prepilin-type N-terminal cleavage/methylation domain-containing protein
MTQAMTVQNKKNIRKNRKGFTLIELIVVIAILAILAAIAIPAFSGTLGKAKERADDATVRVIKSAVRLYQAENNGVAPNGVTNISVFADYLDSTSIQWSDKDAITTITIDTNGNVTAYDAAKPTSY